MMTDMIQQPHVLPEWSLFWQCHSRRDRLVISSEVHHSNLVLSVMLYAEGSAKGEAQFECERAKKWGMEMSCEEPHCKMYKMCSNMLIQIASSTVFALHIIPLSNENSLLCSVSAYKHIRLWLADWLPGNTTQVHERLQRNISTLYVELEHIEQDD